MQLQIVVNAKNNKEKQNSINAMICKFRLWYSYFSLPILLPETVSYLAFARLVRKCDQRSLTLQFIL